MTALQSRASQSGAERALPGVRTSSGSNVRLSIKPGHAHRPGSSTRCRRRGRPRSLGLLSGCAPCGAFSKFTVESFQPLIKNDGVTGRWLVLQFQKLPPRTRAIVLTCLFGLGAGVAAVAFQMTINVVY